MMPQLKDKSIHHQFPSPVTIRLKITTFIILSLLCLVGISGSVAQPIPVPLSPGNERETKGVLEEEKLFNPGTDADAAFGYSLALSADGNVALVGAYKDNTEITSGVEGGVFLYRWEDGSWDTPFTTLFEPLEPSADDWFGWSVAMNADASTVLIGAVREDPSGINDAGAAYVFIWNGSNWDFQQELNATAPAIGDFFAQSVALSSDGNTAIIGASDDDNPAANQGSAYIFTRSGGVWTEEDVLTASDAQAGDLFGQSVSLSADGNTAIIGSHENTVGGNDNQGTAYVFTRSGTVWTEEDILTASDGAVDDFFGWSVGLSSDGNTAIVGAFSDSGSTADQGSAYIFTRSGTVWTQQTRLTADDGESGDNFGANVALSGEGTIAIVGASYEDNGATTNQGAAYIFTGSGAAWAQVDKLLAADGANDDLLGSKSTVSTDGKTFLMGAPGDTIGGNIGQGSAYIFRNIFTDCANVITIPVDECDSLITLYSATNGVNWTDDTGWFVDGDPCNWFGIECSPTGHVRDINLNNNNLVGSIPSNIADLPFLETLAANNNQVDGSLPASMGSLPNIFSIFLNNNQLSGSIPSEFGNMGTLNKLDLSLNQLSGTIPPSLGNLTLLTELILNDNNLTGSIPPSLGSLIDLKILYLGNNEISGSIPAGFGNLVELTNLGLENNRFSGGLPVELGNLVDLSELTLRSNGFSGEFPAGIVLLPLTSLTIDYNMLFSTNPTVITFLNSIDPDWDETQTIPPNNPVAEDANPIGLRVSWTPILYQANNGHYIVECASATSEAATYTINKAVSEVIISGLPAGTYTCTVSTFTAQHASNQSDLTSSGTAAAPVSYGGQDVPPNDPFANPITFDSFPQQNYSLNIENATFEGDPKPSPGDPDCPVSLPPTAVGIHYEIPGDLPTDGVVMNVGGPVWYSNRRDVEGAADTAIVIYEELVGGGVGAIVACDDDNAPGEVSVSNVKFDLDPNKTYRAVVWNEGEASLGAIIEIAAASFDLLTPLDDSDSLEPPTTFTWVPYANTVSYYFKIARTTVVPLDKYSLVELTPDADEDNLTCNALVCTLTVVPDSILDEYLTNGNYLWSVAANMSANDSTLPLVNSNQIFRFIIGEVIVPPVNLLENSNFETDTNADKIPDEWTGKNLSKDKRKCNKPDKVVAFEGECAFVFKGSVNEISSIYQKREDIVIISGHTLTLTVQAKGNSVSADTKIIIKIKYQDSDSGKQVLNFDPGEISEYKLFTNTGDPITKAVASVKVTVKNRNLSGKFYIDAMELIAEEQAVSSSNDTLLPLPPVSGLTGSGR